MEFSFVNVTLIAVFVILVAFSLFYFMRARRTCDGCGSAGLQETGRINLRPGGAQEEYKCKYCGAEEWKEILGGPSKAQLKKQIEVLRELSNQIGGDFSRGTFRTRVRNWTITLYSTEGEIDSTVTRTPYVRKDGFAFKVCPISTVVNPSENAVDKTIRDFGGQDVTEVGYPEFDRDFYIMTNDKSKARTMFASSRIRQLIQAQPRFYSFGVRSHKGVDELFLGVHEIIWDVEWLKAILDLFTETLNQLVVIGSASEEAPDVKL